MKILTSKFTVKAFIPPLLSLILMVISIVIIKDNWSNIFGHLRWIDYFMTLLVALTLVWLLYLEIYRKMVSVKLYSPYLNSTNIFQHTNNFLMHDLDGYETSLLIMKVGVFEEIKIKRKGKTVILISEFYHDNYWELRNEIQIHLKYLGGPAKNYSKPKVHKSK